MQRETLIFNGGCLKIALFVCRVPKAKSGRESLVQMPVQQNITSCVILKHMQPKLNVNT